jgi:UDP-2,4-diacetamido-2,4,6-trideoxy-beta-L-altropyranose hydrolase
MPYQEKQLTANGHAVLKLPEAQEKENFPSDVAHSSWLGTDQATDAEATCAALGGTELWDWLVVDHYSLDARWHRRLRSRARKIFVIDDLADRLLDCDALLDQNLQIAPGRYSRLVRESCVCFIGPSFALLRPQFGIERQNISLSAPQREKSRINVFFGGTDPRGCTLLALQAIAQLPTANLITDVIVGQDNPHRTVIEEFCRAKDDISLHVQVQNMAHFFASANLALGAGGSASWERCCLGLPAVVMSLAENQKAACATLARARVAVDLGEMAAVSVPQLGETVASLLRKPKLLSAMRSRAMKLVDGAGTGRVARHMLGDA